jgi:1,4-dihydroxy-2-naphthoyl-CoA hydrolase
MARIAIPRTVVEWNQRGQEYLPGHLGIEFLAVDPDEVRARMPIERSVCAWNGFLHAGAVVSLADSCCGYATLRNLPEDAESFTTIELKSNFLGTALEGDIVCIARPAHLGRTTQVWDAEVRARHSGGKIIALFRCTQLLLRPRSSTRPDHS